MLSAKSVQDIDIFKKHETKELVLSSHNWDEFSAQISKLGSDPVNNKKKGDVFELLKMKPEYSSVDELVRNEDLNQLKDHWLSVPENKELDERGKSMYSSGFKKLIEFFKSIKNNID